MNKQELDILLSIAEDSNTNQRYLSEKYQIALGSVNKSINNLQKLGYISCEMQLTTQGRDFVFADKKRQAIILAAGYGMRMVPINMETPKGLLEIYGEPIIERQIRFLHEVGITDIYIVVGFMKERYEYLIDLYAVKLIVNTEFSKKNNLHSLALAAAYIDNTYIIPCDVWCERNPFSRHELYSWYMISDVVDDESWVRVNRKNEMVKNATESLGNQMVGIAYVMGNVAKTLRENISVFDKNRNYDKDFWEVALFANGKMLTWAKMCKSKEVVEIKTYEQLRELDSQSNQLKSNAIDVIKKVFDVSAEEITDIAVLKKGMTNRSFHFSCCGERYIMRIPGEGTEQLIDRHQEFSVYQTIKDLNICDELKYINPDNGYKITKFLSHARSCNPENDNDVAKCMKKLRQLHEKELKVEHSFDVFEQILFYESLWNGNKSYFKDYDTTKKNVFQLKNYIDSQEKHWVLTHIDAVSDNFLFVKENEQEEIYLIDWEYAGMQDSCIDIAMFAIYAMYNREQVEKLIDAYYTEGCDQHIRLKIYCYIAACGLLWSNWCEYKRLLGIEFGEYSLRQYQYAKEYYKIFVEERIDE